MLIQAKHETRNYIVECTNFVMASYGGRSYVFGSKNDIDVEESVYGLMNEPGVYLLFECEGVDQARYCLDYIDQELRRGTEHICIADLYIVFRGEIAGQFR